MFETKKDGARAQVSLRMADGSTEFVSVRLSLTAKLNDILNNADAFLDVLDAEGKQYFVAKSMIRRVELIEVPRADQMNARRRSVDGGAFDPYVVLGVARGADSETIRKAYHALVKSYHPDRLAGFDLPREMHEYASALLVRINLAMEQLGG